MFFVCAKRNWVPPESQESASFDIYFNPDETSGTNPVHPLPKVMIEFRGRGTGERRHSAFGRKIPVILCHAIYIL